VETQFYTKKSFVFKHDFDFLIFYFDEEVVVNLLFFN